MNAKSMTRANMQCQKCEDIENRLWAYETRMLMTVLHEWQHRPIASVTCFALYGGLRQKS